MPLDLAAVSVGYGETSCEWGGHTILLRYRADLDNRALIAAKRLFAGVETMDGTQRMPDMEAIIDALTPMLTGWDITRGGQPVPISKETVIGLPLGLPAVMLMSVVGDAMDPNRRPVSANGWSAEAGSQPIAFPTTTPSSAMPAGQGYHRGFSPDSATMPHAGPAGASGFGS